jgi:hypothetical protein
MAQSRTRRPVVAAGSGNGGSGGGSNVRMIVVAVAAVALGALVLAKGLPGSKTAQTTTSPGGSTATTKAPKGTVTTATTSASVSTSAAPTTTLNLAASKVIVVNGAEIDGIAGRVSAKLQERGYVTIKPATIKPVAASVVYYVSGSEEIGKKVGVDLAIPKVEVMPATKPVEIGEAKVMVVLGPEFSEAAIPAKAAPKVTATTTTVAAPATAVTNPTTTKKP